MKEIGLKLVYNQAEQPLVIMLKSKINFCTINFMPDGLNTMRYLPDSFMKIRRFSVKFFENWPFSSLNFKVKE